MAHSRTLLALLAAPLLLTLGPPGDAIGAEPTTYVWVEAEAPTTPAPGFVAEAFGKAHLLSGGQWYRRSFAKEEVAGAVPEGGFVLAYALDVPQAGQYELWARIGMEWVRAPLEWRLDEGEWTRSGPEVQTTNVMELAEWNEIAWLKLGDVTLPAGRATLQIRYREPGTDGRMLMCLDCFALTLGRFVPEGKLKPGEMYEAFADVVSARPVFELPPPDGVARTQVKLTGTWQVARWDDPDMDVGATEPVQALPTPDEYPLRWMDTRVPSSLWDKDETVFAHRVIYRTAVNVPGEHSGRAFKLHFSGTNWLASVFVNGQLAGTHRGVWIPWDLDVSAYLRPGETNELAIAIKGPYYAVDVANYG
jgi:beta-galactosidase